MTMSASSPTTAFARSWPLAAVLAGAALPLAGLYLRIRALCGGALVYGLDDAYIHLAIAANLVEHGTWGVNAGEFSSTSSSLAWPLVLAALRAVTGIGEHGPMIVSAVLVVVILVRADAMLARRTDLPPWVRAVALGALFAVTPMPELVFNGMEHLLHVWLTLELLDRASLWLAAEEAGRGRRDAVVLVVIALLITTVRYEAAFQVGIVAALLAIRRSWGLAAAVAVAGALPLVTYGILATSQGWPFLPTGLLLKTAVLEETAGEAIRRMINEFAAKIPGALPLVAAIAAGLIVFALRSPAGSERRPDRRAQAGLYAWLVFALASIPHLVLANLGNLFRYEAYLYAAAVFATAQPAWRAVRYLARRLDGLSHRWVRVTLLVVALGLPGFTLVQRAGGSLLAAPLTSLDIHRQQIQMARFVERYYPQGPVAINDIGTISYFTDAQVLDIVGLASREVTGYHLAHDDFAPQIGSLAQAQGVRVALVYEPWLGDPPLGWTEVATWTVPEKIVLGWPEVTFYAVAPGERDRLLQALYEFRGELPAGVEFELAD